MVFTLPNPWHVAIGSIWHGWIPDIYRGIRECPVSEAQGLLQKE